MKISTTPIITFCWFFLCFTGIVRLSAAEASLRAGPLVGAVEMREARIWLQTDASAEVRIEYWPMITPDARQQSAPTTTIRKEAFTGTLVLDRVAPGTVYQYAILLDGERQVMPFEMRFETPPFYRDRRPPPDFSVALASGHYVTEEGFEPPYTTLAEGYDIANRILEKEPQFVLWLGNSVYMREPDWGSLSGYQRRYTHNRSKAAFFPLFAGTSHVFAMGPGEYGPSSATRWFYSRKHALDAFEQFTANSSYGFAKAEAGANAASHVRWGDAEFFLLDVRSFREANNMRRVDRSVLGEEQIDWLIRSLATSEATFKIVAAGVPLLNPNEATGNLREAPGELDRILEALGREEIPGVVFMSGGKGWGELTKRVRSRGYNLFDLTVGPLTRDAAEERKESNFYREPGTSALERHFAMLEFSGDEGQRALTVKVFDADGEQIWMQAISAAQLGY